jgi:CRP-like cAMP-binding protein
MTTQSTDKGVKNSAADRLRISGVLCGKVPILANLSEDDCRYLQMVAETLDYQPGQIVIRQGEESRNLWIVLNGKCEVIREPDAANNGERPVVLAQLEPHQHFGEMSFFNPAPHSVSVRAKTALRLLRFSRAHYDRLVEEDRPAAYKIAFNAIAGLAQRLRHLTDRVAELENISPSEAHSEWSTFRGKLFDGWNV